MKKEKINGIISVIKGKATFNAPMRNYTTFGIGGYADVLVDVVDINDLKSVIVFANDHNLNTYILGEGSNVLVKDNGIRGIVVRLKGEFLKTEIKGNKATTGSGVLLNQLVRQCSEKGLTGIEFLAGIPGTVGGAVIMNAGAWGSQIFDYIESVTVFDMKSNEKVFLTREKIKYEYRKTDITKRKLVVLFAEFKLKVDKIDECTNRIDQFIKKRKQNHPFHLPNAGCIFKNPGKSHAGKIIEEIGFKNKQIGNVQVSGKHANFIVNMGSGKASDVIALIEKIEKASMKEKGVKLEREIVIIGED